MELKIDASYPDFDELSYSDYAKLFKRNKLHLIYPWCISTYQKESSIDINLRIKWSYADNLYVYNDWKNTKNNHITIYAIVLYDDGAGIAFVGNESEIKCELKLMENDIEDMDFDIFVSDKYIHYDQFYDDLKLVIDTTNNHAVRYELNQKFIKKDIQCT